MPGYTYSAVSGRNYSYLLFSPENLGTLPMQGGNYIFALNNAERTPIFIEATNSVHASVARQGMAEWKVAKRFMERTGAYSCRSGFGYGKEAGRENGFDRLLFSTDESDARSFLAKDIG
jgi:hypothetical protein